MHWSYCGASCVPPVKQPQRRQHSKKRPFFSEVCFFSQLCNIKLLSQHVNMLTYWSQVKTLSTCSFVI